MSIRIIAKNDVFLIHYINDGNGEKMKVILNKFEPKEIIKIIREWSELTQADFAKKINRSKDTVQSYELGRNKMSLDKFMEIAKNEDLIVTIEKRKH